MPVKRMRKAIMGGTTNVDYSHFKVEPIHFRGKKKFGRATQITHLATGKKSAFIGSLTKKEAIEQWVLHNKRGW